MTEDGMYNPVNLIALPFVGNPHILLLLLLKPPFQASPPINSQEWIVRTLIKADLFIDMIGQILSCIDLLVSISKFSWDVFGDCFYSKIVSHLKIKLFPQFLYTCTSFPFLVFCQNYLSSSWNALPEINFSNNFF